MGFSCRRDRQSSVKGETSAISAQKYPRTGPASHPKSSMAKRKKLATYMDSPTATSMPRLPAQRSAGFWLTGVELSTDWELDALMLFLECDSQLIELFLVDAGRRIRHQVLRGGGLREGDNFADGF